MMPNLPDNTSEELDDVLMDLLTKNYQTKYDEDLDVEVIVNAEEAVEKAKQAINTLITQRENAAQKALLDKIYDIAPDKQFGKWKPADVADFWNDMGILSRELDKSIAELSPKPLEEKIAVSKHVKKQIEIDDRIVDDMFKKSGLEEDK